MDFEEEIINNWEEKEIREYFKNRQGELKQIYQSKGIILDNPQEIAGYLLKNLKLSPSVKKRILKIKEEGGRDKALAVLEQIAINQFPNHSSKTLS